ncbi:MAG: HAD-IA family hydrolase [Alphaproteobacteria bacterium]|nr:HAD-IA family hydrolase [Alphaproteobacteria bacterium]
MTGLVVFDVDGTILDSYTLFEKAVHDYSREKGLPAPNLAAIRFGYSDPRNHDFKWGVSVEEQVQHLLTIFDMVDEWSMSGEHHRTPLLFEGVEEALMRLKGAGHTLGIVTSKPEAPLLHLLKYHGVQDLFATHRNWNDIKRRGEKEKPEPDMLQSVMRELGFAPERTVMVGDTTMDVKMGRAAGAHTVGVSWGMHPRDYLSDAGAHHIVDTHFKHLLEVIDGIFAASKTA